MSASDTPNRRWSTRSWISRASPSRSPRPARLLLLRGRDPGGRDERGGLAERPQQVAFAVAQLEPAATAVGADHAIGRPGRRHRRADERRDPQRLSVIGGKQPGRSPPRRRSPGRRAAPSARSAWRAASAAGRELRRRRPVGSDRAHPPALGVRHEDRRAPHRRQPADRLADPVVEFGRGRVGIDLGEQLDEDLERLDPREQRRGAARRSPCERLVVQRRVTGSA